MDARMQKRRMPHVILICLSSFAFMQTASAGWTINTCEWSAFSPSKGAFYAYFFSTAGLMQPYCFGAYAESAQGACDDVLSQIINAFPSSPTNTSWFSPANPDSRIGNWGRCGFYGNLLQLRAPKNLVISLSSGNEVEPSKGLTINPLPFIATVIDKNTNQSPSHPVTVRISLKVDPRSGGHDHGTSDRPRGGIANVQTCPSDDTCWSWTSPANNGVVVFNFNAPEASGTYTITATCDGCSNNPQTATISVKVKEADAAGWDNLSASPDYELVGGETGKAHSDNHYLTAIARENLLATVGDYNSAYPAGPLLYLNDASLVWGGKFDIFGTWAVDHKNHRRGVVIDIRANQLPTAIPLTRFNKFKRIAANNGAFADLHCAFPSRFSWACWMDAGPNRHFHVRLLGKGIDR